jgi:hypothetical protein
MLTFILITISITVFFNTISYSATSNNNAADEKYEVTHDFSLTISPFHLILPIYEFTGEFNINQNLGLALIGGYGNVKISKFDSDPQFSNDILKIYEIGGQINYYPIGSFDHGLQLGVEVLYVGIIGNHENIEISANGIAVGPFIGYKIIFDSGFTLNFQLGYEKIFAYGKASDGTNSASDSGTDNIVLLNINAGWSF